MALVGFLAIKPPAIGGQTGEVIVTPDATITPAAQPNLRDFDDEGNGPDHDDYDHDDDNYDYKPKSNLTSEQQAPITAATPGVIPMPNLGGGDDDEDEDEDEDEDDDYRKGLHHDHDDDDESDEDDDD